ncbi:MAG: hypothetical protein ACP5RD_01955 [bacterium]
MLDSYNIKTFKFYNFKNIFISFKFNGKENWVDNEIYFILIPGGSANRFIFESYERVFSNFGYVVNGNYVGVLNENEYYNQIYNIYSFLIKNNKKVALIGHSAGSNLILILKLNSNSYEHKEIYFLLAMNSDLAFNNVYVINGLFDEMHPIPETIKITKQNYYLTFTNHIGQLTDFNTIYNILYLLKKDYNYTNSIDIKFITLKEFLIYFFTIFLFCLIFCFYEFNFIGFINLLVILFFYFIFKFKFSFYNPNFILSAIILNSIFTQNKLRNYLKIHNNVNIINNFGVLILCFVLSSLTSNIWTLFNLRYFLSNVNLNIPIIFSLFNLLLGLSYHLIKTIGYFYLFLFFILVLIIIFDKFNFIFYLEYLSKRIIFINKFLSNLNLLKTIILCIFVVLIVNVLNLILLYFNFSENLFDFIRFIQFILKILLTLLIFIIFLKFKKFS